VFDIRHVFRWRKGRASRAVLTLSAAATLFIGVAAGTTAAATSAQPVTTPSGPTSVNVCSQAVAPGYAACLALKRTDIQPQVVTPNLLPSGYGRPDLVSAYALPSAGGTGQTVAIVDAQDDPNAESDLAT